MRHKLPVSRISWLWSLNVRTARKERDLQCYQKHALPCCSSVHFEKKKLWLRFVVALSDSSNQPTNQPSNLLLTDHVSTQPTNVATPREWNKWSENAPHILWATASNQNWDQLNGFKTWEVLEKKKKKKERKKPTQNINRDFTRESSLYICVIS